jgi:hypothetical protein
MEDIFSTIEPDRVGKTSAALGGAGVAAFYDPASLSHPLADLLGIEWILARGEVAQGGLRDETPPELGGSYHLYRRGSVMRRATFVTNAEIVQDSAERLQRLGDRARDPRTVVILEDPDAPIPTATADPAARVEIIEHADELVRIEVHSPVGGYLRLADPFDPGWRAPIAGPPAELNVAAPSRRAVWLQAGNHTVEFRYDDPLTVRGPQALSLLGLASVLGLGLLGLFRRRKTPEIEPPVADPSS